MTDTTLHLKQLTETAQLPRRAHDGDAGFDLFADQDLSLRPGEHALVSTGIAMKLPAGTVGMVCPRSGLAAKSGITVLNAPGIVDSGYRGEVKVILINHSESYRRIRPGDAIAQLVIAPFLAPQVDVVDTLDDTDRGAGGFGSTGAAGALSRH